MAQTLDFGCKKCGSVLKVELHPWSDRIDLKVQNAKVEEHFGKLEVRCKKCNTATAIVGVHPF